MFRSLRPLTGPRWKTSSQGKATQFRAWENMGPAGPAWGMMRQEGKEESRDPLSIPRAASHKEQKLKLAKDRKATRNPCRGWGRPCFWPTHHSYTYTQEMRLLSRDPQACPTGMGGSGEQGHHASNSMYSEKPLIHSPTLLSVPQPPTTLPTQLVSF